jgi:rare lipoprotein A
VFCYEHGQEVNMIALIPGLTAALGYLRPGQPASSPPQDGFPQVLTAASQASTAPETGAAPSAPRYVVQAGDNLSAIAQKLGYDNPQILAGANNLKDPDRLQIGQTLTLPENSPALQSPGAVRLAKKSASKPAADASQAATRVSKGQKRQLVVASWYGSQHHGKLMANGRPFDMYADTVAHKSLPLGTPLTLTNPQTGTSVKVQVTDRGPYIPGRNIDLSYSAAQKLGVVKNGVAKLWMEGG